MFCGLQATRFVVSTGAFSKERKILFQNNIKFPVTVEHCLSHLVEQLLGKYSFHLNRWTIFLFPMWFNQQRTKMPGTM
jgi:hypothetical protein